MEFVLGLRVRGIADVNVLRALELVPREAFAPHKYRDLALRDVALPIACGQTMPEPFLVARMIEALRVEPGQRVLEIGTGSGYATAILASLGAKVVSYERFKTLAHAAQTRLAQLAPANVSVVWGDGLALAADSGPYDRILVHGVLNQEPDHFLELLADGGVIVAGRRQEGVAKQEAVTKIVRYAHKQSGLNVWRARPEFPNQAMISCNQKTERARLFLTFHVFFLFIILSCHSTLTTY
jgi:protein-L-isoaspartate(D-aspartate) O-methyltransferase